MKKEKAYNWTSLAAEYDMNYKFLKLNCKSIMKELNKCVGRDNYRNLTPKQVELIRNHIS